MHAASSSVRVPSLTAPLARAARRASRAAPRGAAVDFAASFGETIVVNLKRPMGLVLNSGREETGAYVAEVVEGGNAEEDDTARPTDVLISCGLDDADCRGIPFDDVMDRSAATPTILTALDAVRCYARRTQPNQARGIRLARGQREERGRRGASSGLQYKVLNSVAGIRGRAREVRDTPCSCHYAGTLLDGTEFDSSYRRGKPITFAPKQVIKGWTEAMQLMAEGDKWELYLPAELGYGGRGSGSGSIKPGDGPRVHHRDRADHGVTRGRGFERV